jgi:quercetin dioxygenase-like cupin family protein
MMKSIVTILIDAQATDGRLALLEVVEQPGGEPPIHRHYWEDELLYVLTGELVLFIEGKWLAVPPGRAIMVPRGVEHTFAVLSTTARMLALFTPAGFESFYRETGLEKRGERENTTGIEQWVATAARYGCEVTGPHPGRPLKTNDIELQEESDETNF